MSLLKVFVFTSLCLTMIACSSQRATHAKFSAYYDFSTVASYSTFARNSHFSDYQNISDTTRNSIELAIEQVLDAQGLQYQSSAQADVLISYHLINRMSELNRYNKGVQYCRPCLSQNTAEQGKVTFAMRPGSLLLDIVNKENHRAIWRSVYPLNFSEDDNSFEQQEKIYRAIEVMLSTLPKTTSL
ncbi:DUF4136 domain-containing protein [Thalassotalea sp. G2M2-11]|uniref:DUF4136 domain-containing protein n=1 Tax=Thalassotalea sp. G2M2-11 TaxID=2787627 RepID=UPI0019D30E11|nr:DUF4136 domain-containing protein [Thalassotalea sp. G2M2-11]